MTISHCFLVNCKKIGVPYHISLLFILLFRYRVTNPVLSSEVPNLFLLLQRCFVVTISSISLWGILDTFICCLPCCMYKERQGCQIRLSSLFFYFPFFFVKEKSPTAFRKVSCITNLVIFCTDHFALAALHGGPSSDAHADICLLLDILQESVSLFAFP